MCSRHVHLGQWLRYVRAVRARDLLGVAWGINVPAMRGRLYRGECGGNDVQRLHVPGRELRVQPAQLFGVRSGLVFTRRQRDQLQQLPVWTGGAAA